MSLPYPPPERVRTTKRCQFSLPGRRYDCRRVGAYVLNGKHYCAPHYDTTWKVQNPLYGQRHDWHAHVNKGDLAVNSQETAKKVLQDLEVVEYKREGAELIKLGN